MSNENKPKRKSKPPSHPDDFVRAWCEEPDAAAVARRLNITPQGVRQRAASMRRRGVQLPQKGNVLPPFDAAALNRLVRELQEAR